MNRESGVRLSVFVATCFATIVLAGLAASSAGATTMMSCTAGPSCHWGYNYVGVSVNPEVDSIVSKYFYGFVMSKNSGGWIRGGFFGDEYCWRNSDTYDYYSTNIIDLGCHQLDSEYAVVQWVSGNTSYLQFSANN
jgi:hypothetical protein